MNRQDCVPVRLQLCDFTGGFCFIDYSCEKLAPVAREINWSNNIERCRGMVVWIVKQMNVMYMQRVCCVKLVKWFMLSTYVRI